MNFCYNLQSLLPFNLHFKRWVTANQSTNRRFTSHAKDQFLKCTFLTYNRLVTNHVWSKKYLGLYDYEAQETMKRKLRVEGNGILLREADKLVVVDEKMDKIIKGIAEVLSN